MRTFKIFYTRMIQGRLIYVICFFLMTVSAIVLYSRIQLDINRVDNERKELALAVMQLKSQNIRKGPMKRTEDSLLPDWKEIANSNIEEPMDNLLVIYNRVPKTASTSVMGVAYDLCVRNKFHVLHINTTKNLHILSLSDQMRFVHNITTWKAKKPAIYHGHMAFLNFQRLGTPVKPIYINVVRKPLDRFISYYYFLRNGDDFRPNVVRRKQGNKMTFDECVSQQERECDPENLWLQIPFFCGHTSECWTPGSEWALAQAKRNLIDHYLLVGVTEELQDFLTLLEVTLPRFFRGATKLYIEGKKSHLRKTYNKVDPSPETVAKIQTAKTWQMENEFYDFVLQQFHFFRKRTLTVKNGVVVDKGMQFLYEKVRPR